MDASYRWAFILGAVISSGALVVAIIIRKQGKKWVSIPRDILA
jgi:hypothetical protein